MSDDNAPEQMKEDAAEVSTAKRLCQLNDALSLSHVPRWAIVRTTATQTVADHCYRTALIAFELAPMFGFDRSIYASGSLLWYALNHDIGESVTGDIPSPVKRYAELNKGRIPVAPEAITLLEIKIVKMADLIEAYTWLKMNGIGPHADAVCDSLMRRIRYHADHIDADYPRIIQLIQSILNELGRLRE